MVWPCRHVNSDGLADLNLAAITSPNAEKVVVLHGWADGLHPTLLPAAVQLRGWMRSGRFQMRDMTGAGVLSGSATGLRIWSWVT